MAEVEPFGGVDREIRVHFLKPERMQSGLAVTVQSNSTVCCAKVTVMLAGDRAEVGGHTASVPRLGMPTINNGTVHRRKYPWQWSNDQVERCRGRE